MKKTLIIIFLISLFVPLTFAQQNTTVDWDEILNDYETVIDLLIEAQELIEENPTDYTAINALNEVNMKLIPLAQKLQYATEELSMEQALRFNTLVMKVLETSL